MSEERLYCPDFTPVFGKKYANPFLYRPLDGFIWPVFTDIKLPEATEKLLALKYDGRPMFYRRKISAEQMLMELESGGFIGGLIFGLETSEDYGIPAEFVIKTATEIRPFYAVLPLDPTSKESERNLIELIGKYRQKIAGVSVHPYYSALPDSDENGDLMKILNEHGLPLFIDLCDLHLPRPNFENGNPYKVLKLVSELTPIYENIMVIILDPAFPSEFEIISEKLKYNRKTALGFTHRSLGGMTPAEFYGKLLNSPGFPQNWWGRLILGSGSPALEPSQLTRGWIRATSDRPFHIRCLMRTWPLRNPYRICNIEPFYKTEPLTIEEFNRVVEHKINFRGIHGENGGGIVQISYDLKVTTFAVTQLIGIKESLGKIAEDALKRANAGESGGFINLKSYHTTCSLLINEHEIGNYLQLHYELCRRTDAPAESKLHTVAAEENRADFNYPDHITASAIGRRSITVPIRHGKPVFGGREYLYFYIPFGPRSASIAVDIYLTL